MPLHKRDDLLKAQPFFLGRCAFKVENNEPEKLRCIGDRTDLQHGKAVFRRFLPCCDNSLISAVDDTTQIFGQPACVVVKDEQHPSPAADTLESLELTGKIILQRLAVLP